MATATSATASTATGLADSGHAWTNPNNAKVLDAALATCLIDGSLGEITDSLALTGFSFAVPASATITGVAVAVRHKIAINPPGDANAQLYNSGNLGSLKSALGSITTGLADTTFGGSSDVWGAALTPAIVNAATFGVWYYAADPSGSGDTISLDGVSITVSYALPGGDSTSMRTRLGGRRTRNGDK